MTTELTSGRRAAKSGTTRSVVVFLHGYGANGADLLGLADPLSQHMPDTVFIAPDAPGRLRDSAFGFQWFPIPWIDGSSEAEAATQLDIAAGQLNAFLDKVLEEEGIAASQMALVGFSQGTMMALHVGPRRAEPVAAVVGFSGRLLGIDRLSEVVSRPPVLLIHGDADDVVPVQALPEAAKALDGAGFEVFAHISKGTAHGIAPDGLSIALSFLHDRLQK